VLLVAEGAGCFAAAWWARLSPADYVGRVAGALFFEPGAKDEARFASPRVALPFPSVVVGDAEMRALADGWGSSVVDGDEGPFVRAQRAVQRFTATVVEREVSRGERLWLGVVR
jgi:predicted alpha/beta hydrolase family esterase